MKLPSWKVVLPHVLIILLFLIVAVLYCYPTLQGQVLNQSDIIGWKGMAQQSFDFKDKYGHFPLWSNSMFSGMPAYQIALEHRSPFSLTPFYKIVTLGLPKPIYFFFIACVCFYILSQVVRVKPWIGCLGAIAYAYSTFNPIIVAVGHDTQMFAIGYAPAVIAGFILLFRKEYWKGAAVTAVFLGLQMSTSHLQIVYYTLLMVGALFIAFTISSFKAKDFKHWGLATAMSIALALLAVGSTAITTLTSYDYVKYSMRGGHSELSNSRDANSTEGGLNKDYAFNYSYGIGETLTLLDPGAYGGGDMGKEFSSSEFADKLSSSGYPEETAMSLANGYSYWGQQPGTAGPVYLGAVVCFLFFLGLFASKSWHRWWILGITIFGILLAWGKNFEAVNYLLYDYLPFYKKFRAVTMALVIPQLTFPLMAIIGLHSVFYKQAVNAETTKKIKWAGLAAGGALLLLLVIYTTGDFKGANDNGLQEQFTQGMLQQLARGAQPNASMQQQASSMARDYVQALQGDRKSLFMSDFFRTLLLVVIAYLLVWFGYQRKLKADTAVILLLLLSSFDILSIGRRYFNADSYTDESSFDGNFAKTPADNMILQDTGYYRVFDQQGFMSSRASYYHNSIGGYSPAKLSIYQDLIDSQIMKYNLQVFNMLNTKYFIMSNPQTGQKVAQANPDAFGPAWMTSEIKFVPDAAAEMEALDSTDLRHIAVVQQSFRDKLGVTPQMDSSATISLIENRNDSITYKSTSTRPQFAVFSEIYYPAGWTAWVDGKEQEIIRTDYALRGLALPAGEHTIIFRFEPASYNLANSLLLWSSLITYLLVAAAIFFEVRKTRRKAETKS